MEHKINSTTLGHKCGLKMHKSFFFSGDAQCFLIPILRNKMELWYLYLLRGDLLRLLGDRLRRRGDRDLLLMGDRDLLLDGDHLLGGLISFDLSRLDKISSLVRVLKVKRENSSKIRSKVKKTNLQFLLKARFTYLTAAEGPPDRLLRAENG